MSSRLHLTRSYSLRSLIGIAIIAVIMVGFHRYVAVENLKAQETSFNVSLAASLSVTLLPYYAEFVREARLMPAEALAHTPQFQAMRREIADRMRGLRVVKVKIYDSEGLTVFSTDLTQIGSDESTNPAFARVMRGETVSELSLRGNINAFNDEVIEDVDVLSTYIPIRRDGSEAVEGGFEIFSDVTALVRGIERTSYTILAGVTVLLLLLYAFLLAIVQRADRLIDRHERERLRHQQSRMEYLARYDALTELPNRSHFMALLSDAVNQARRDGARIGMICLAIDRFKLVNDSLGHEYGDRALIEYARRLRTCVGDEPVIARIGGDQFAIMDRALGIPRTARGYAERIVALSSEPMQLNGREIVLTASLGLAVAEAGAEDAELLMENAISAMRTAKQAGRNGFVFFTPMPGARPRERLILEMDLRKALAGQQFELHYQPRVDTRTGTVSSLEALLRWRHPQRGLLMPTEFVPLLEDMDLMDSIGAWVLEEACRQTHVWRTNGHRGLRVSVNVSLRQFRAESLLDSVRHALETSGLDNDALELEMTESVLADDLGKAQAIASALRTLGVHIAIDDFGTGYSSLSYLIHFPVSYLKIDRLFISDLPDNTRHAALVTAIAAMASSLNLHTVAEGVENQAQYDFLRKLGYSEIQGFWLGPPRAADEIPQAMQELAARALGSGSRTRKNEERAQTAIRATGQEPAR